MTKSKPRSKDEQALVDEWELPDVGTVQVLPKSYVCTEGSKSVSKPAAMTQQTLRAAPGIKKPKVHWYTGKIKSLYRENGFIQQDDLPQDKNDAFFKLTPKITWQIGDIIRYRREQTMRGYLAKDLQKHTAV